MMMLTKLWDNMDQYEHQKLLAKMLLFLNPLLISLALLLLILLPYFPVGIAWYWVHVRILLIYAEPIGKRISWPAVPDPLQEEMLVAWLKEMRTIKGEMDLTIEAKPCRRYIPEHDLHR